MPDVALGCEWISGVWLVSNEGCMSRVQSLISVVNESGGCSQKKLKRLMQAKRDTQEESEMDHLMRVSFRVPAGSELWVVPKSGPIRRAKSADAAVAEVGDQGEMESALVE